MGGRTVNIGATEIERKWITDKFPEATTLRIARHHFMKQAYFAVTPEMECRLTCRITTESFHSLLPKVTSRKLTIKQGSGLIRPEFELQLTEEQFLQAQQWVKYPFITKEVICFKQPAYFNDRFSDDIVVCHVDPGMATGFYYIEVEFADEKEAASYELPRCINAREVTGDSKYSMKNYWLETRCNK